MPRPKTKAELLLKADRDYTNLWNFIISMNYVELNTKFDFSKDRKKRDDHWKRDKNLRDILVHLHEWHQLLLKWIKANKAGVEKPFLPEPYNRTTYTSMNRAIWNIHQTTTFEDSKSMFIKSHIEVMSLIRKFTNEELFTKEAFSWTGTSTLGSYCCSVTSRHYRWALNKLKAHRKNCQSIEI